MEIVKLITPCAIGKFEDLERTDGYQGMTGAFRLKSNGVNDRLFAVYEYERGTA